MERKIRLLFVEDDKVDQTAFERLVKQENLPYDYVIAGSVSQAREALAGERFDVVLVDYLLGDGTAIDLFDQVEDAPIVVITGGGDEEEVAVAAMRAGAYDYLIKDPAGNYLTTLPITVEGAMQRKEAQEELRLYRERLEELVEERTAELTRANEQLRAEIAERMQVQEAQRAAERDKESILDGLSEIVTYYQDADLKIVWANRAAGESVDLPADELVGRYCYRVWHGRDRPCVGCPVVKAFETGQPERAEMTTPDGRVWLVCGCPVTGEDGSVSGAVEATLEITERVRAEEALARERNLLRTLIDNLPDLIYVKDMESRFLAGNAALARMLGAATPDDILGKTDFDFFPHEVAAEFRADEREALESGQPLLNKEERWIDPQGITHWLLTSSLPLRDAQGGIVGLAGISREITERVRAEEALRASEERFAVAFRANPNAVAVNYLESGRYVEVNDNFVSMYGYDHDEVIGRTPLELKLWEEPEQRDEFMQMLREQDVVRGLEFAFRPKSGEVGTARLSAGLIDLGGEPCMLTVTNDITEQIRLAEQLRQAQRMEAVGQLTGGIAHDFNNLLTAILGFTHLMQLELSPDDPLYDMAERILYSGQRAASLTSQLLAFSRKQIIQPRILDLNTVIPEMDEMLQRIIGEDMELSTVLAPDLWPVNMDPTQVEQIIVNIAVNARDAMPRGGQLTIEVANAVLDEDVVADRPETEPGEYVQLTISDTGVGMSEEVMARIFEPFFTTKEVGQGTGLGLSTVYGIVKQNHGDIQVYSQVGQGTTFKIYIPRAEEVAPSPAYQGRIADMPGGTETVLVVEDDLNVRDLVASILRTGGYTVLEAANAGKALRLAEQHAGDIHLLLADVVLPGVSGTELADRLEVTHPGIKVLLTSGYTGDAIARRGVHGRDFPLVEKPFSPLALARKVRALLDE